MQFPEKERRTDENDHRALGSTLSILRIVPRVKDRLSKQIHPSSVHHIRVRSTTMGEPPLHRPRTRNTKIGVRLVLKKV
ncbi:hypothetical protein BDV30DRAFT_220565 [Aspergillus minisclerotigenes]|uniref:Uncharacterized protein n=1 Tax=Aspergillus minisclerotigenes TaxID=656917 RepID=A0A5N6ILD2_9EURO|nr:hypothetical protein BDV30DRAFT_220565 [Aspergillus minisclerotigenes]